MGGTKVSCGNSTGGARGGGGGMNLGGGAGTKFGGGMNCRSGTTGGQHFLPAQPLKKTIAKIR